MIRKWKRANRGEIMGKNRKSAAHGPRKGSDRRTEGVSQEMKPGEPEIDVESTSSEVHFDPLGVVPRKPRQLRPTRYRSAYLLGYTSRVLWMWHKIFWSDPDFDGVAGNVPFAVQLLREARQSLADQ